MTIQRYNFFIWPCKLLQVPASFCKIFPWIFEKFFVSLHYHNNNLNNNVQWLDLSVVANSLSSIFPGSPLCLPGASLRSGWITIRASAAFLVSLAAPTRRRRFNWFTPSWASPDLSGSFLKLFPIGDSHQRFLSNDESLFSFCVKNDRHTRRWVNQLIN